MNAVNCLGTWRINFCYQEWTTLNCACTSNCHVRPKTRRILRPLLAHLHLSLHYWEKFSLQVTGWKLDCRTTQTLPCDSKEQNRTVNLLFQSLLKAGKSKRTVQISNCVSVAVLVLRVRLFRVFTECCQRDLLGFMALKLLFTMSWQPNINYEYKT